MENMVFNIQTHETNNDFPFKLFYNLNGIALDHCHTEIEIIYVLENEMETHINGIAYNLHQGDVMIATSGDIHSVAYTNNLRMVVQFKLDMLQELFHYGDDINSIYDKLHSIERTSINWGPELKKSVGKIMLGLKNAHDNLIGLKYRLKIYSLLYQLIDILVNNVPEDAEQKQKNSLLNNKKAFNKIEKLFIYIHNNYDKNITLEQISADFHYSVNYFTKLWKKYIGTSFHSYLNEYRIKKAMALLKDTDYFVVDIAYKTGFQSIKSFNRVFKSVTNISPSEYRETIKQQNYNNIKQ